jgi:acyl dehydratase
MRLLAAGGLPLAGGINEMSVEITWLKPVRPGDVLCVVSTVQDIKRSKSKRQGVATVMSETQDKFGEVARRLLSKLLVTAREAEASSS